MPAGRARAPLPLLAITATVLLLSPVDGWLGAVVVVAALVTAFTLALRRRGRRAATGPEAAVFVAVLLVSSVAGELVARDRAWEPAVTLAVAAAAAGVVAVARARAR